MKPNTNPSEAPILAQRASEFRETPSTGPSARMTHPTPLDLLAKAERPPTEIFDAEMLWTRVANVLQTRPDSTLRVESRTQFDFIKTRAAKEGHEVTPVVSVPETLALRFGIFDLSDRERRRIRVELPLHFQ